MKKNLNSTDRIIRVLISLVFAILFFSGTVTGTLGVILLALGVIFTLTSVISFCPIYAMMGLSTSSEKS